MIARAKQGLVEMEHMQFSSGRGGAMVGGEAKLLLGPCRESLQVRKLKLREDNVVVQGHTAN